MYLDTLGAARVLESAEGLLEIAGGWRQRCEHCRQGVAAQTLLQHPCQLRVAVGDEHALLAVCDVHKGVDDVTQAFFCFMWRITRDTVRACEKQ